MPATRRALLAGLALSPLARPACAAWPERPISWVVPFASGGITDSSSRVLAARMAQSLGQGIVVENRPGAGGTIGGEYVARAAPDGYTLLYGSQGVIAAAPAMHPNLRYDPVRDLAPVHAIGASPHMLVVPSGRPWRSLADLVEAARRRPDALSYGSPGIGTSPHLAAELLQRVTGVRMTHAPYANGAQALNDLIGGRLDLIYDYPLTSLAHVREGRLRALAVTDTVRVALAPEIPTMAEAGFPGTEALPWAGLFLPAATPAPILARLATVTAEALRDAKVQAYFDGTATRLWHDMGTEAFRAFLAEEMPRIRDLIERSGARAG
jgi:tripartite-type tricarboxylate transporter receptor subunit TctC